MKRAHQPEDRVLLFFDFSGHATTEPQPKIFGEVSAYKWEIIEELRYQDIDVSVADIPLRDDYIVFAISSAEEPERYKTMRDIVTREFKQAPKDVTFDLSGEY